MAFSSKTSTLQVPLVAPQYVPLPVKSVSSDYYKSVGPLPVLPGKSVPVAAGYPGKSVPVAPGYPGKSVDYDLPTKSVGVPVIVPEIYDAPYDGAQYAAYAPHHDHEHYVSLNTVLVYLISCRFDGILKYFILR